MYKHVFRVHCEVGYANIVRAVAERLYELEGRVPDAEEILDIHLPRGWEKTVDGWPWWVWDSAGMMSGYVSVEMSGEK